MTAFSIAKDFIFSFFFTNWHFCQSNRRTMYKIEQDCEKINLNGEIVLIDLPPYSSVRRRGQAIYVVALDCIRRRGRADSAADVKHPEPTCHLRRNPITRTPLAKQSYNGQSQIACPRSYLIGYT
jgi:hypothetical protein